MQGETDELNTTINCSTSSSTLITEDAMTVKCKSIEESSKKITQSTSEEISIDPKISFMSPKVPEVQEYDSDCLIIDESDDDEVSNEYLGLVTSTTECPNSNDEEEVRESTAPYTENILILDDVPNPKENTRNLKLHNLPIHELKRKLAYCSICFTQYQSHKQANLCLSKHGSRQCWLCLEVMPNTKDSYFQHCVKNHAIGQTNDIVGCPYCKKFFDFRQGFNQHIVKVHFSEDTSYVTTTACLSPKSLVDIYTGQSRSSKNDEEVDNPVNDLDITTTTNENTGISAVAPESTPFNPYLKSPISLDTTSDTFSFNQAESLSETISVPIKTKLNYDQLSTVENKEVNNLLTPTNEIKSSTVTNFAQMQILQKSRCGSQSYRIRRESVIRETPHPHFFSKMHGISSTSFEGFNPLSCCMDSCQNPSIYYPLQNQNPTTSKYLNEIQKYSEGSSRVLLSLSHNSRDEGPVFTIPNENIKLDTLQGKPKSDVDLQGSQQFSMNSGRRPEISNFSNLYVGDTYPPISDDNYFIRPNFGVGEIKCSDQPVSQYPPVGVTPSPSLLGMQKLVKTAPVHLQYFNSVNSMLRTVSNCSKNDNSFNSMPQNDNAIVFDNGSQSQSIYQHSPLTKYPSSSSTGNDSRQPTTSPDSVSFKIPLNSSIKRRILNKWDEHQDIRRGDGHLTRRHSRVPSTVPVPTELPQNQLEHAQVKIQTKINPNQGRLNHSQQQQQGTNFWEQVLKESNQMYQTVNGQMAQLYGESFLQNDNGVRQLQNTDHQYNPPYFERSPTAQVNFGNKGSSQPQYPRIMARVDSNGRALGIFTSNGQPCLLSSSNDRSNPSPILQTTSDIEHYYDFNANHLQYQHKIIRQLVTSNVSPSTTPATANNNGKQSNFQNDSTSGFNGRKRKFQFPLRSAAVYNPNFDSVVVQNPFEEESTPIKRFQTSSEQKSKGPNVTLGNAVIVQSSSSSSTAVVKMHQQPPSCDINTQVYHSQTHNRYYGANVGPIATQRQPHDGRIMNYQPKLTSGGEITDYSQPMVNGNVEVPGWNNNNTELLVRMRNSTTNFRTLEMGNNSAFTDRTVNHLHSQCQYVNKGLSSFTICPRYQETTNTLMYRLKDLERQKRKDIPHTTNSKQTK